MARGEAAWRVAASEIAIVAVDPAGQVRRIGLGDLAEVHVETSDGGPFVADVWLVLVDEAGADRVVWPLEATGASSALAILARLPGFQLCGMSSTTNVRHLCWRRA